MSDNEYPVGSAWRDARGDVWTQGEDGAMVTPESPAYPRERVEEKWGPLVRVWTRDEITLIQLRAHRDWLRIQPYTDPPDPKFLEHDATICKKCIALRERGMA